MFLTAGDFNTHYGIDQDIASYFVDRKVPTQNLYWKNRTIYLPSAPGYIFIPIYFDLLLRTGADKHELVNGTTAEISEYILDSAARLEDRQIKWKEHILDIKKYLSPLVYRKDLFELISEYLEHDKPVKQEHIDLGTSFPSLNRADSYLYLLSTLHSAKLNERLAIDSWYALITYFLILDDLSDIREDLENQEENVWIDAGMNQRGIDQITSMMDKSISVLSTVNPVLSKRMENQKNLIDLDAIIRSIRSSS